MNGGFTDLIRPFVHASDLHLQQNRFTVSSYCASALMPHQHIWRSWSLGGLIFEIEIGVRVFAGHLHISTAFTINQDQSSHAIILRMAEVQITCLPDEWGQRAWAGHLCANKQKAPNEFHCAVLAFCLNYCKCYLASHGLKHHSYIIILWIYDISLVFGLTPFYSFWNLNLWPISPQW